MQLELFFKVEYVCTIPKEVERYRIDETGDYFAIETDTMIDIVRMT